MDIGQKLHQLRISKDFSQGDIEKRSGLVRCYVSRVENGFTVPNLETLRKWAAALDVEMYQLFFEGKGNPQPAIGKQATEFGREERELVAAFKSLNKKDQKFAIALVRKMAREKRPAKRSS